jgi:hypothetical protein
MTLKLTERDHEGEVARAFFAKDGAIANLLKDGSFRLSYGNPTACRVKLRWNRDEKPGEPWLEALGITRFNWGGNE